METAEESLGKCHVNNPFQVKNKNHRLYGSLYGFREESTEPDQAEHDDVVLH